MRRYRLPLWLRARIAGAMGSWCVWLGIDSAFLVQRSSSDAATISHTALAKYYAGFINLARPDGVEVQDHMAALCLVIGQTIVAGFEEEAVMMTLQAAFQCIINGANWKIADTASAMKSEMDAVLADKGKA